MLLKNIFLRKHVEIIWFKKNIDRCQFNRLYRTDWYLWIMILYNFKEILDSQIM
jgi:hypothetical protein